MRGFVELLKRFHSDERGIFAVLFAVMGLVLIAFAGAVVDFTSIEQARTRSQQALDSASLGLQPQIFVSGQTADTIKVKAQALLTERLNDSSIVATVGTPAIDTAEGTLTLTASVVIKTAFVALIGIPSITANVVSQATRKQLNLEVAMVLDNSGSMNNSSRMTNLKKAALCAMNILYNNIPDCLDATVTAANSLAATSTNVKIGIVPFTSFVNVGTGYANATWMDTTGLSSISNDNFDNNDYETDTYTGTVNRFALYDTLGSVSWDGCVEARPYPYDTDDTVPTSAMPDTLFVPTFAPDEPDSGFSNSYLTDRPAACTNKDLGTWSEVKEKSNCTSTWSNNASNNTKLNTYNNCGSTATVTRTQKDMAGSTVTAAATQPATMTDSLSHSWPASCSTTYSSARSGSWPNYRYRLTVTTSCTYKFSDRVLQERLCKYTGNINTGVTGPNGDCPTNALQPLTATKSLVKTAIDAMYPQGYTNIHQGTIWGFHMLSPTAPLTEAGSYLASTSKVLIVMTDGENTVTDGYNSSSMNKADGYLAYGYPGSPTHGYNGRIYNSTYPDPSSNSEVTASMDSRTVEACDNARAAGITVYTIGLSAPNQTTIDMLTDCADDPDHDYFPTSSTELVTVFQDIAEQLSNLRLAK